MLTDSRSSVKKFVQHGLMYSELDEFFQRRLADHGYAGLEVRRQISEKIEVIVKSTRIPGVMGEGGNNYREMLSLIKKKYSLEDNNISLIFERIEDKGLCAISQCESLRYKLFNGIAVRKACYSVLRFAMESGAKGCEIVISGKIRGQRAKSMKFVDGFMIHSGQPAIDFVDRAVRHVLLRQGVLGVKVKIMLPFNTTDLRSKTLRYLPDTVVVLDPPEESPDYKRMLKEGRPIVVSRKIRVDSDSEEETRENTERGFGRERDDRTERGPRKDRDWSGLRRNDRYDTRR